MNIDIHPQIPINFSSANLKTISTFSDVPHPRVHNLTYTQIKPDHPSTLLTASFLLNLTSTSGPSSQTTVSQVIKRDSSAFASLSGVALGLRTVGDKAVMTNLHTCIEKMGLLQEVVWRRGQTSWTSVAM